MFQRHKMVLGLLLLGTLAACGTDAPTIRTDGMRFVESTVEVKTGQPVTLELVNQDGYAHAFDLDEFGIHAQLPAQESVKIAFTPDRPGTYSFYCGAPGHRQAGMTGVLRVMP